MVVIQPCLAKRTIESDARLQRINRVSSETRSPSECLPMFVNVSQTTLVFAAANSRECNVKQAIFESMVHMQQRRRRGETYRDVIVAITQGNDEIRAQNLPTSNGDHFIGCIVQQIVQRTETNLETKVVRFFMFHAHYLLGFEHG